MQPEWCQIDIGAGSNSDEQRRGHMAAMVLVEKMDHKPQVAYAERLEHDGLQSPWRRDAMDPIRKVK